MEKKERDTQIGGYLRPDEGKKFDEYIQRFKLRKGVVPTLLILRELRCSRLPRLKERYPMPPGNGRKRISARPTDLSMKKAFKNHVAQWGMAPDPAAGILFRAELHEKWLERATMESD